MFCNNCGKEIAENAAFCAECGAPVAEAQAQPQPEAQPQATYAAPVPEAEAHHGEVTFQEAITLYFKNYANFKGRASKSEFWWGFLFGWLVSLVANVIPGIGSLVSLALLIPNLSLAIRRLHDIGKSWVYYLMGLIPLAGFIILIVYYCKDSDGDNQWGPGPKA